MTDSRTWKDRLGNWFFGIPWVAQVWAKQAARQTAQRLDLGDGIPWAGMAKPLSQSKVALLTTGGIHLPDQPPFDMADSDGDATYREIPGDAVLGDLVITHNYYNHTSADADPQVIFPLDHFRDLVARGIVGGIAPRHFGFMGHIEGVHMERLLNQTAPEVAAKLRADGVDFAFLTPA